MSEELPDKLTLVTPQEMADAFFHAWYRYWGVEPEDPKAILVLLAQWALETGRGKSMHNFNVGNVKARPGGEYDWQFYFCNEKLKKADAELRQKLDPATAKIKSYNNDGTCWIEFYPKNPVSCFRAFKTLDDGVFDHLSLLIHNPRYQDAWTEVVNADPVAFAKQLHMAGYYTAPVSTYTAGVVRLFKEFEKTVTLPEPPLLSIAEAERINNMVAMSLRNMADGFFTERWPAEDRHEEEEEQEGEGPPSS